MTVIKTHFEESHIAENTHSVTFYMSAIFLHDFFYLIKLNRETA
jgi:hypothetical protein